MDAAYQHVVHAEASFSVERYDLERFPFFWHFHPEHELTLIAAGRGRRHVGDHVGAYGPGDLVLLGPDLPHSWLSAPGAGERSVAVVVRFRPEALGDGLVARPELRAVRDLLERCRRGLAFPAACESVRARVAGLTGRAPLARLLDLIAVLDDLASVAPAATELASPGYRPSLRETAQRRMADVCAHVQRHHARPLPLAEVAGIAHMTPPAFSRAFRRATGRTFTQYVNEVRVGAASRLLVETDLPVAVIAADCGYTNLANFNRRFRTLRRTTPSDFRDAYRGA